MAGISNNVARGAGALRAGLCGDVGFGAGGRAAKRVAGRAIACLGVVLAVLVTALSLVASPASARAASGSRTGSISLDTVVQTRDGSRVLAGDEFSLAQVATATVGGSASNPAVAYVTVDAFKAVDRDWSSLTSSQLHDAAVATSRVAARDGLYATAQTVAAGQTRVAFRGLEPGLYLIARTKVADGNKDVACDPALVSVPVAEAGVLTYDVSMEPKFEWTDSGQPEEPGGSETPGATDEPGKTPLDRFLTSIGLPQTGDYLPAIAGGILLLGLAVSAAALFLHRYKHEG